MWLGAPPLKMRIRDFALPGPVRVAQAERARVQNASARGEEIGLERGGVQVRGDGGGDSHRCGGCQFQSGACAGLSGIQADELTPGQEQVCYLKTFWLRIVQRRWKKVFKLRKEILRKRSSIKALQERQRTGKWPIELRHYPEFKLQLCY